MVFINGLKSLNKLAQAN